jgi:hypothetical protein
VNRLPFLLAVLLAGSAAMGCHSVDNGSIQIITDEEAGTFTESPAPTELQVVAVESPDASTVLATAQLPTSAIDLGTLSESAPVVSLNITGYDANKTRRVFGATLPVQYAALAGQTIPIFVQRTGEFARLPGPLTDARHAPLLAVVQGEYLLVAGGSDSPVAATTQFFDFGGFDALGAPPTLPVVPQSIALSAGTVAWLINAGGSTYFDFSGLYPATAITAPAGGSFADVAGGATVVDPNGAQYVVGGTRTSGAASAMVLKIDPNDLTNTSYPYGNASWLKLGTARLGAGAAWVIGSGLVIAGGNPDATGPGAEVVNPDFSGSTAFASPADESFGVGAVGLGSQRLLLAGGVSTSLQDPGVREVDLSCTPSASATCVTSWGSLPVALVSSQAFAFTATDGLVVGSELLGRKTRVFRLSPTSATEVLTRVPHNDARAAWSPVGSIALFGGANDLESFTP